MVSKRERYFFLFMDKYLTGAESCVRIFLETLHIMQGAELYQELGEDFISCKIMRKKFIKAAFGTVCKSSSTLPHPCSSAKWTCSVRISCMSPARRIRPGPPQPAKLWRDTIWSVSAPPLA